MQIFCVVGKFNHSKSFKSASDVLIDFQEEFLIKINIFNANTSLSLNFKKLQSLSARLGVLRRLSVLFANR